ncbi:TetR-like C-terminal domain-containing protein [Streptomyces luteogriseus]|uniref:TetR-like C-terminal domain-containing protein n=1 Tax=Streptomyces luteogriseus TaxID=68233 RepID=UPI00379591E7
MDEPQLPLPGTSIREDLVITFEAIRRRGLVKRTSALVHGLLAQAKSYPKLWDLYYDTVVEAQRRRILTVLARGTDAGELRDDLDPDLMVDLLCGPILSRAILQNDAPLPDGLAETIADTGAASAPMSPGGG